MEHRSAPPHRLVFPCKPDSNGKITAALFMGDVFRLLVKHWAPHTCGAMDRLIDVAGTSGVMRSRFVEA
jgi:hypothetical protein